MKKIAFIGILILLGTALWAQQGRQSKLEKIAQLRVAFYAEYLDLTVEEGQQFWPLFNAMEKEQKAIRKERKQLIISMNQKSAPTEAEVKKFIEQMGDFKAQEAQIESKFLTDCLPILGPARIVRLAQAEEEFRRKLLKEKLRN